MSFETQPNGVVVGDSGIFTTTMDDARVSESAFGSIPVGTTVASLKDRDFSSILSQALFPLQFASIATNTFLNLSGFATDTVEVGSTYSPNVTASLNLGQILHGTGEIAGTVAGGGLTQFSITNPLNETVTDNDSPWNVLSEPYQFTTTGNRSWLMEGVYPAGTTVYTDGEGNIVPDVAIDLALSLTSQSRTLNKSASYKRFTYMGARGSSPTDSANTRSASWSYLNTSNNANYNVVVPAGTSEFSLYIPTGKNVSFLNTNTNAGMNVPPVAMDVDDAGGLPTPYERWTIDLGLNGFPTNFTLHVEVS